MCRQRDTLRSQAGPAVITITSAGTSVSAVRTLEKSRVRQTSQYDSSSQRRHCRCIRERG